MRRLELPADPQHDWMHRCLGTEISVVWCFGGGWPSAGLQLQKSSQSAQRLIVPIHLCLKTAICEHLGTS